MQNYTIVYCPECKQKVEIEERFVSDGEFICPECGYANYNL